MDHTIVHFEIPADDVEGLTKFYGSLFDWKIAKTEVGVPPGMDYRLGETVPTDERGVPTRNGINGAIYGRQEQATKLTYYIQVESVDGYGQRVTYLGGSVVGEKTEIPEVGWALFVTDPEGNPLGLFEPWSPREWCRLPIRSATSGLRQLIDQIGKRDFES